MKESSFYSDDFEQLIREKTEQYKMYPSERVWKGVHNSLHTKRKWFIGSMSLLVTGILFFAGRELISPSSRSVATRKPATTAAPVAEVQKTWLAAHAPHPGRVADRDWRLLDLDRAPPREAVVPHRQRGPRVPCRSPWPART